MFEVGKKVICVETPCDETFKKGQVFTVLGVEHVKCCNVTVIDIGLRDRRQVVCNCGSRYKADGIWWTNSKFFAPLTDETPGEVTAEEVLEVIEVVKTYNERYLNAMRQMKDWGFYS